MNYIMKLLCNYYGTILYLYYVCIIPHFLLFSISKSLSYHHQSC